MNIPLSPCVPENLVSRDGFSRPVPRQPAHLHTQTESGAYLRDSSRVPSQVKHSKTLTAKFNHWSTRCLTNVSSAVGKVTPTGEQACFITDGRSDTNNLVTTKTCATGSLAVILTSHHPQSPHHFKKVGSTSVRRPLLAPIYGDVPLVSLYPACGPSSHGTCCCCCLHIKNRSDLYPVPFSFLLFKTKKRISVVTS